MITTHFQNAFTFRAIYNIIYCQNSDKHKWHTHKFQEEVIMQRTRERERVIEIYALIWANPHTKRAVLMLRGSFIDWATEIIKLSTNGRALSGEVYTCLCRGLLCSACGIADGGFGGWGNHRLAENDAYHRFVYVGIVRRMDGNNTENHRQGSNNGNVMYVCMCVFLKPYPLCIVVMMATNSIGNALGKTFYFIRMLHLDGEHLTESAVT